MSEDTYPRWFNKLTDKNNITKSTQSNPYTRLLIWLVLLFLIFLFFSNLYHWFSIEILGTASPITSEELSWISQQTPAEQKSLINARAETEALSSLQNALFILLFTIPFIITIVRIKDIVKQ